MRRPRVEILYVDGCPNHEATRALVERVAGELDLELEIELVQVPDAEAASELRFLGSPSVRVDGRDVEPSVDERGDFVFSCRLYRGGPRPRRAPGRALDPGGVRGRDAKGESMKAQPASAQLPARTAAVLAAADIPPSKLGSARVSRLSELERGLYTYAMCAIDALGIAPMFEQPVEVASRDPLSGEAIGARVAPSLDAEWRPAQAVVVTGAARGKGDACTSCCPVLNFFASSAGANRWLARHPEVSGEVISIREALVAGRAFFGDVLRGDGTPRPSPRGPDVDEGTSVRTT